MYGSKPTYVKEAVSMLLFIWDNTNTPTIYGNLSLKRGLNDFFAQCGNTEISNTKELKTTIDQFFMGTQGNLTAYNERCFALHSLFNWLIDKGYTSQDLSRDYEPVC